MTNFETLMAQFDEQHTEGIAKGNELSARLQALQVKSTDLRVQMDDAMQKELNGEKVDLAKAKRAIVDNHSEIETVQQLIKANDVRTRSRLTDLLPALEEARSQEHAKNCEEIRQKANDMKRRRCEFLLEARSIGEINGKGRDTESLFQSAIWRTFGNHPYPTYQASRKAEYPTVNLISNFEGVDAHVAPIQHEIIEAMNLMKVPYFVLWYKLSGELIPENEARRKLDELRQREAQKKEAKSNG
jgi:hypothetical protein